MPTFDIPDDVVERLREESRLLGMTLQERLDQIVQRFVAPADNLKPGAAEKGLRQLDAFLRRIPGLSLLSISEPSEAYWWVKFNIDITHPLAWNVVQELGFVLNYISIMEPLPTIFKPVSPPPYLNGGPKEFLSWVIEAKVPFLDAGVIAAFLQQRLPNPVEDHSQWPKDID